MAQVPDQMITTTFDLPGRRLVRNVGVVRGIVVRSRSVVGNLGAALQTLVGGNITIYTELCEQSRREAYEDMRKHAAQVGANAVIGMRYDATEIAEGGERGVVLRDGGGGGIGSSRDRCRPSLRDVRPTNAGKSSSAARRSFRLRRWCSPRSDSSSLRPDGSCRADIRRMAAKAGGTAQPPRSGRLSRRWLRSCAR
jgi:uncharacterized protein YbjQ (UPF0145 family)